MSPSMELAVALVGVGLTALGFFWGVMRYVQARIDGAKDKAELRVEKLREEYAGKLAEVHARIDATRNEYARRDDLNQHLSRIEGSLSSMHRRLDDLLKLSVVKQAAEH